MLTHMQRRLRLYCYWHLQRRLLHGMLGAHPALVGWLRAHNLLDSVPC